MDGVNVAVCTMEKANSIVNRLAEEARLEVKICSRLWCAWTLAKVNESVPF